MAFTKDFLIEVAKGNIAGHSLIHKFGFNDGVNSTLAPITDGAVYQTPTAAVSLEIVSSDANDTAAGTGAQAVTIVGLDASWNEQTVTIATNGTTAAAVTGTWLRVYRMYVGTGQSGTYATSAAGSHAGTLTLRVASAGATWATIGTTAAGFPLGQTEIGCYTVPAGYTGYLLSLSAQVESAKTPNLLWFRRPAANDVTTPYDGMRVFHRSNATTEDRHQPPAPMEVFTETTDMGVMGYVGTGTAAVSVTFQMLLVAN